MIFSFLVSKIKHWFCEEEWSYGYEKFKVIFNCTLVIIYTYLACSYKEEEYIQYKKKTELRCAIPFLYHSYLLWLPLTKRTFYVKFKNVQK